jgi:hypothetical protein
MTKGLRYDAGKLRMDLIPPEWEEGLAEVLTKGAEKYEPRNWELGMPWSKIIGSARRHLLKFQKGERYDPETGCHHLFMAAWNILALASYDVRGLGENDLPNYVALALRDERSVVGVQDNDVPSPKETVIERDTSDPYHDVETFADGHKEIVVPKRDPLKVSGATFAKKSIFGNESGPVTTPVWSVMRSVELANNYSLGDYVPGDHIGSDHPGVWKVIAKKVSVNAKPDAGREALYSYDFERVS